VARVAAAGSHSAGLLGFQSKRQESEQAAAASPRCRERRTSEAYGPPAPAAATS